MTQKTCPIIGYSWLRILKGSGWFMEEKGTAVRSLHKLILNQRKTVQITGVKDVISFDMNEVLLETDMGMLQIKGKDLHVNRLNVERGEVDVEGMVDSLAYSEVTDFAKKGESLVKRLFR